MTNTPVSRHCGPPRSCPFLLVCTLVALQAMAQAPVAKPDWTSWRFLVGEWIGEGGRESPGEGAGRFSFAFDLQDRILVRKNHVDYPPAGGRPASVHDDLLIVFALPDGSTRAHYYDNEGHVILYDAVARRDSGAVFLSDLSPSSPRFRLSYTSAGPDSLLIAFEIAPPGRPDRFVPYLKGKAHRVRIDKR